MNAKCDFYFNGNKRWQKEIEKLRVILLDTDLEEELKWGCPCYTYDGANIVLIHVFKDYCALLFHKGVLLKDPKGVLIRQTENVQAARQMRFTDLREIIDLEPTIRAYVKEAIALERSGAKVELKKTADFRMVDEFRNRLEAMPKLKKAFDSLTPGRQRGYLLYFSSAKQAKTREARIDKCVPDILKGKGLHD